MKNPFLITFEKINNGEKGIFSIANTSQVPFEIKRIFWIFEGKDNRIAGEHAHKEMEQILIALQGIIKVTTENSDGRKEEFVLDEKNNGLYIPAKCWHKIEFKKNAALLSFSSMEYDSSDYIRNYNEFRKS